MYQKKSIRPVNSSTFEFMRIDDLGDSIFERDITKGSTIYRWENLQTFKSNKFFC